MKQEPLVYIVDDDPSVRKALQATLRAAGFKSRAFESPSSFFKVYNPSKPGCLLLDVRLPNRSGMEILEELQAKRIGIPVIIITGYGNISTAVRSLKLGATDFLEKPIQPASLITATQAALAQDAQRRSHDEEVRDLQRRLDSLTWRERTLLRLIVAGSSNKIIAADLGISIKTVINIRARLMDKMKAVNAADLVRKAVAADHSFIRAKASADGT